MQVGNDNNVPWIASGRKRNLICPWLCSNTLRQARSFTQGCCFFNSWPFCIRCSHPLLLGGVWVNLDFNQASAESNEQQTQHRRRRHKRENVCLGVRLRSRGRDEPKCFHCCIFLSIISSAWLMSVGIATRSTLNEIEKSKQNCECVMSSWSCSVGCQHVSFPPSRAKHVEEVNPSAIDTEDTKPNWPSGHGMWASAGRVILAIAEELALSHETVPARFVSSFWQIRLNWI